MWQTTVLGFIFLWLQRNLVISWWPSKQKFKPRSYIFPWTVQFYFIFLFLIFFKKRDHNNKKKILILKKNVFLLFVLICTHPQTCRKLMASRRGIFISMKNCWFHLIWFEIRKKRHLDLKKMTLNHLTHVGFCRCRKYWHSCVKLK